MNVKKSVAFLEDMVLKVPFAVWHRLNTNRFLLCFMLKISYPAALFTFDAFQAYSATFGQYKIQTRENI